MLNAADLPDDIAALKAMLLASEARAAQSAYSGDRDRRFRPIVTAAHQEVLRGQILRAAVTMGR